MDPPASAAAARVARDEELRGECAKAFAHYKKGNLTRATDLLKKLLARHPAHPLLHFAYTRLSHMLMLDQRQQMSVVQQFHECSVRVRAAVNACPHSLLPRLLCAQAYHDIPAPTEQSLDVALGTLRAFANAAGRKPLNVADLQYAKAIATFDEELFTLALLPDVRECADPDAYRREAGAYTRPLLSST